MHTNKKAVLMISLGTPDSPGWFDVASYLSEFLGDGRDNQYPIISEIFACKSDYCSNQIFLIIKKL